MQPLFVYNFRGFFCFFLKYKSQCESNHRTRSSLDFKSYLFDIAVIFLYYTVHEIVPHFSAFA